MKTYDISVRLANIAIEQHKLAKKQRQLHKESYKLINALAKIEMEADIEKGLSKKEPAAS